MLRLRASQAGARQLVIVEMAPWPQLKNVDLEGMRVLNAVWARQQRAITAVVGKRREGVNVGPEALLLGNARQALPQRDISLPCYLLDLKETMNALFRFSMRRETVCSIRFG